MKNNNNFSVLQNSFKVIFIVLSFAVHVNAQSLPTPSLPTILPAVPTLKPQGMDHFLTPPNTPSSSGSNYQNQQNQRIMDEVNQNEKLREQTMQGIQADIDQFRGTPLYDLPSWSTAPGAELYKNVFEKMLAVDVENYSVKDLNFQIENAYLDNKLNKDEFDKVVRQTGAFLKAKMKELKYDNSNLAKNYILFQFFSEKMTLKSTGQKHESFKYDFDDYMGTKNWSKMFVSKLIHSGSGQCHSLPLLYLILAEEIGAEAYLSLSPNHTYIKFQDEKGKWYNLELTNGMFTTNSFILNSGFIKAEAMQSQIYMQPLTKKQLLSQFYTDLAAGYYHKFGYDEFVGMAVDKALELYPKNINANMIKANYNTARFENAMKQLKIDPTDKQQLQHIRNYPQAIALLQETNGQYQTIDDLGFDFMPADAYEKWLGSLKKEEQKQENDKIEKQFKTTLKIKKTLD